jgi:hypothetical protein
LLMPCWLLLHLPVVHKYQHACESTWLNEKYKNLLNSRTLFVQSITTTHSTTAFLVTCLRMHAAVFCWPLNTAIVWASCKVIRHCNLERDRSCIYIRIH